MLPCGTLPRPAYLLFAVSIDVKYTINGTRFTRCVLPLFFIILRHMIPMMGCRGCLSFPFHEKTDRADVPKVGRGDIPAARSGPLPANLQRYIVVPSVREQGGEAHARVDSLAVDQDAGVVVCIAGIGQSDLTYLACVIECHSGRLLPF